MSFIKYKNWFDSYTHSLIRSNPNDAENYELKVEHTYRVVDNMNKLTDLMQLDIRRRELGEIIALFHDLGRFVQFSEFGTFSEAKTGSHATLSVQKLQKEKMLSEFSEEEVDIIYQAIEYHNHLLMPKLSNESIYTLGTVLRDADKLDAFFLSTNKDTRAYSFDALSQEALYSEEIVGAIMQSTQADFRDIKYGVDRELSIIALVFNLELSESFQVVKENNYVERMFAVLACDEKLLNAKRHCMAYVNARIL